MNIIHAPNEIPMTKKVFKVFLGGSIEMGKAEDWQAKIAKDLESYDVTLLNPRRPDWDSTWKQDPDFLPFREQVEWEQYAIAASDIVIMNFCAGTMSPISLLELGIMLGKRPNKVLVCCPKEFYRYGNVKITCDYFGANVYENMDELLETLKWELL
jgi:hypothetical protein